MANFDISDGTRFPGDFVLAADPSYTPTAAEAAFLALLARVIDSFAADAATEARPDSTLASAIVERRATERTNVSKVIRAQAQSFIDGALAPAEAVEETLIRKGMYLREVRRLDQALFVIRVNIDNPPHANDVTIHVNSARPVGAEPMTDEKQKLFVDAASTLTTIKSVLGRQAEPARKIWHVRGDPTPSDKELARINRQLSQYMHKLAGVCRVGLEGPQVGLAATALVGLRHDFVVQEAARIKNGYVVSLGFAAVWVALAAFLLHWLVASNPWFQGTFMDSYRAFLIAAGGAAIGTWLSFSIRRVALRFEELAVLEEDLLNPFLRILFVVGLTMTVCLLFATVAVGEMKTEMLMAQSSAHGATNAGDGTVRSDDARPGSDGGSRATADPSGARPGGGSAETAKPSQDAKDPAEGVDPVPAPAAENKPAEDRGKADDEGAPGATIGPDAPPTERVPVGAIALLIGIFCGIAERALATAISGRAATFVRGVGGG